MVVLILTATPTGLRGELSRWLLEPKAGVFVGNVSARIREKLWDKVIKECKDGSAVMVLSAKTEQGYAIKTHGDSNRIPVDMEGVTLIKRKVAKATPAPAQT